MTIVYFIGASGVGKSTICKELSNESAGLEYVELDGIYRYYEAWKSKDNHLLARTKTKEKLQEIEKLNVSKLYLIDAGSFAQKYLDVEFWENRRSSLVCIKNSVKFCYANYLKRDGARMSFERWEKSEFSSSRKKLYLLARYVVDGAGLDVLATKQKVLEIISRVRRSTV